MATSPSLGSVAAVSFSHRLRQHHKGGSLHNEQNHPQQLEQQQSDNEEVDEEGEGEGSDDFDRRQSHHFQEQQEERTRPRLPNPRLIEVLAAAGSRHSAKAGDEDAKLTPCKTCVFVLERIKSGLELLPSICSEIYMKYPDSYGTCHQVLNSLTINGVNSRTWLFAGCNKYEKYNAKEWIEPCPSHVLCAVLKGLDTKEFCTALPMEDPFKEESK